MFRRYAAFFRPDELDTLTVAFEATWQELTLSGVDLSSEEKVASLKTKLAQRILVSATAGAVRDIETMKQQAMHLNPKTVRELLVQALLDAPMFGTRWRWVAGVALALPRFRGGKKVPPQLMRMMAEDLLGTIFPDQVACAENSCWRARGARPSTRGADHFRLPA